MATYKNRQSLRSLISKLNSVVEFFNSKNNPGKLFFAIGNNQSAIDAGLTVKPKPGEISVDLDAPFTGYVSESAVTALQAGATVDSLQYCEIDNIPTICPVGKMARPVFTLGFDLLRS